MLQTLNEPESLHDLQAVLMLGGDEPKGPPGDEPKGPPGDEPKGPPGDEPKGPPGDHP